MTYILIYRFTAQKHRFKPYLISPAKRYISQTREKQALFSAVSSSLVIKINKNASHCVLGMVVMFDIGHTLKNAILSRF